MTARTYRAPDASEQQDALECGILAPDAKAWPWD
jgi:hypothetical protein